MLFRTNKESVLDTLGTGAWHYKSAWLGARNNTCCPTSALIYAHGREHQPHNDTNGPPGHSAPVPNASMAERTPPINVQTQRCHLAIWRAVQGEVDATRVWG